MTIVLVLRQPGAASPVSVLACFMYCIKLES